MQILRVLSAQVKIHQIFVIFETTNQIFVRILHYSLVLWDINPLYFFSWNFIYFQQKEPIKVLIWWDFTWTVESLKFCPLMGSFCPNHIKFQLKNTEELPRMTLKSDAKLKEKLTCGLKMIWGIREFSLNHSKVWNFVFNGLFLSKLCKVWAPKIQGELFLMTRNSDPKFE